MIDDIFVVLKGGVGVRVLRWGMCGGGGGCLSARPGRTVLRPICILILYKSAACSMGLSEMDAQVYNTQGRRYGNEGNIIPRSHKPPRRHVQEAAAGGIRLVTARCLAQMS